MAQLRPYFMEIEMSKEKSLKCDKCKQKADELMAKNDFNKEVLTWLCEKCYTARHGEFEDVKQITESKNR